MFSIQVNTGKGKIAQWLERLPAMQKVPGSNPGRAAWIWVYYSYGSAGLFGWDVKPRSGLCSTPNMDGKDPDITEEENL